VVKNNSTLNVEATCSSETSIGFERTTRLYYIPEEINSPVSTLINARKSVYAFANLSSGL
jgi:hypothetical protein